VTRNFPLEKNIFLGTGIRLCSLSISLELGAQKQQQPANINNRKSILIKHLLFTALSSPDSIVFLPKELGPSPEE
jgi:hypothetical protein